MYSFSVHKNNFKKGKIYKIVKKFFLKFTFTAWNLFFGNLYRIIKVHAELLFNLHT